MNFVIAISILALSLKILTLFSKWGLFVKAPKSVIVFFAALLSMNVVELISFETASQPSMLVLKAYYIFAGLAAYSALYHILESSARLISRSRLLMMSALLIFSVAVIAPNVGISGVKSIGYSITRVPGPYYWVIQVLLLSPILTLLIVLTARASNPLPAFASRTTRIQIMAFGPLAIVGVLIIFLMAFNVKINGAVVISLTVCLTIWVLIYATNTYSSFRLLSLIPSTPENKAAHALFDYLAEPRSGFNEAIQQLERMLLSEAMQMTNGNKTKAAEMLGLARPTFLRKLSKHDLSG
ncbi:regulatory Fis family protein [Alteromonadaceae bacterium 2753L.S.0a.02]|nr:regulatory Fis family protein [Alteromonadaceae bacterium 2753L.S.0a.02]